jgi:hypothetical protein
VYSADPRAREAGRQGGISRPFNEDSESEPQYQYDASLTDAALRHWHGGHGHGHSRPQSSQTVALSPSGELSFPTKYGNPPMGPDDIGHGHGFAGARWPSIGSFHPFPSPSAHSLRFSVVLVDDSSLLICHRNRLQNLWEKPNWT